MNCPICKKQYKTVEETDNCLLNHPIKDLMNFEPLSQSNILMYINMMKRKKEFPKLE